MNLRSEKSRVDMHSNHSLKRMMTGRYLAKDCGFLRDMIIHHEIALIMSRQIYLATKNPRIMEFSRNIIYCQELEISQMRQLLQTAIKTDRNIMNFGQMPANAYSNRQFYLDRMDCHVQQKSEVYFPLIRDAGFYASMERMHRLNSTDNHTQNKNVYQYKDDKIFLHDMLYHHQVAVEMALDHEKHSSHPTVLALLRNIIWTQSKEIWHMKMMLEHYSESYWLESEPSGKTEFPNSTFAEFLPDDITSRNISQFNCRLE